jgi:hypothetical protein
LKSAVVHCAGAVTKLGLRRYGGVVSLLACLLPSVSVADAIMITRAMTAPTIAEIFIGEHSVRVEFEIGGADLRAFGNLIPDSLQAGLDLGTEPLAQRLPVFFGEDFAIRTGAGERLPGRVVSLEKRVRRPRDEITGESAPSTEDEAEPVLFAVLEYPFDSRPSSLIIAPPRSAGGAAATVGFVVYHLGLPVNDFRYLSGPVALDLDWQDPWYSKFRTRNLRRQFDAPLNVFLYAEPYEVRVEVIARPHDLQHWVDLGVVRGKDIPVSRQAEIKQRAAEFIAEHIALSIDGEPVVPEFDRVHFLRRNLRSSRVIDPPEDLDAFSATLGVIFVAPTSGLPKEATLTWDLFSPRIQRVPAAATDEAGPLRFYLDPSDPVLRWQNFLKHPTLPTLAAVAPPPSRVARLAAAAAPGLALLLAAAAVGWGVSRARGRAWPHRAGLVCGLLAVSLAGSLVASRVARVDDEAAAELLSALLGNVYRAFDYRDESAIYDALERSVAGDLLTDIYLETRRSLELASQGGARAKVKAVELLDVEVSELSGSPGFVARGTWNVMGSVGHWGHIHTRTNQYQADLTLEPVAGQWKITALELLQEERL